MMRKGLQKPNTMESGRPNPEESSPLVAESAASDGLIPQLFTSMPTLNEAASYLSQTTTYFTGCFTDNTVEYSSVNSSERELKTFRTGQSRRYQPGNGVSAGETSTSYSSSPSSPTPEAGPDAESLSLLPSSRIGNGISIFQGLIERARRTVRGSADDIGWLQRTPGLSPVEDRTEKFNAILDNIRHGVLTLPKSVVYLLVPGLFSNHGSMYFIKTKTSFSKMGLACHIAKIHSEASVENNARQIKEYIEEMYWGSNKRVMLLGHSKGGIDSAAALSLYWPELKDKVAGLVLAQSPYGGSPVASDILREGQLGDYVSLRSLMEIVICKVLKGDMQALIDLTYEKRKEFVMKHELPRELPVVSFHTEAGTSSAVVSTLSHVAHAELELPLGQPAKLPLVVPFGAAMAACAQVIQARYGEKSDGLVARCDAEVPGSVVVRPTRKLEHAWMVYSPLNDDPSEPDASQVSEALLTLLVDVEREKMQSSQRITSEDK